MAEEHRPRPPARPDPKRPLRATAAAGRQRLTETDRPSTLHARGVRILRDGTVRAPRPRVRQPSPIRLVRRRPPMRLPLASAPRRLHVLLIAVAMALSLCAGRLLQLQGFDSSSYPADALTRTLPLLPARGEITDRNGLVLASTQPAVAVTADPTLTAPRAAEFASVLAGHLGMSQAALMPLLTKTGTRFVYLKKKVPALTYTALAAELASRNLRGIFRESDPDPHLSQRLGRRLGGRIRRGRRQGPGRAGAYAERSAGRRRGQGDIRERTERQQDPARPEVAHAGTERPQLPAHPRLRDAVGRRTPAGRAGHQDPRRLRLRHRSGRQDRSSPCAGPCPELRLVAAAGRKI